MNMCLRGLCRIAVAVLLLLSAGIAAADETRSVSAFSTVESQGNIIPSANGGYRVISTISGPFFVDTGEGPMDAGDMTCIGDLRGDTVSGRLQGSGSCVLTARDGAQLFADFTCEGVAFVGCRGGFVVNGGSGRLEGFTGGGAMTMRTSSTEITGNGMTSMASSQGRGIVFWDDFAFIPPAEAAN